MTPEKPRASFAACCSAFFRCHQLPEYILRTRQTAIFTSKAPALVVCCPNWLHPRGCCPATSGTSCGRNLGVIDRILNEWCDPFVSAARLNEWFTTNFGAADELTADYRSPRRRAADCGGAGRTATGIGRGKGIERLLQQNGAFSRDADVGAQRTQRNSGRSHARASLCKLSLIHI